MALGGFLPLRLAWTLRSAKFPDFFEWQGRLPTMKARRGFNRLSTTRVVFRSLGLSSQFWKTGRLFLGGPPLVQRHLQKWSKIFTAMLLSCTLTFTFDHVFQVESKWTIGDFVAYPSRKLKMMMPLCSNPFCRWFWSGFWVPKHLLKGYLEHSGCLKGYLLSKRGAVSGSRFPGILMFTNM